MAHIKQIIGILRDFIHSPEHRVMASTISKLKMDLDFDSTSINQIHLVLFGFQDAVSSLPGTVGEEFFLDRPLCAGVCSLPTLPHLPPCSCSC